MGKKSSAFSILILSKHILNLNINLEQDYTIAGIIIYQYVSLVICIIFMMLAANSVRGCEQFLSVRPKISNECVILPKVFFERPRVY